MDKEEIIGGMGMDNCKICGTSIPSVTVLGKKVCFICGEDREEADKSIHETEDSQ
ncbi:MAG TPA: hypothetical protein VK462_04865 [Nitrososphaeraceae archaeon]|nr:hypothetical protein [Nitrososphaeraceae archaeon]